MKAAIFIVLYGNEASIERGLEATLTKATEGLPIHAVDNHYPMWSDGFVNRISKQYNITIHDLGSNVGLVPALNYLNETVPTDYQLLIEGDSYAGSSGWDKAILDVLQTGQSVWATIHNRISYEDMSGRTGCYHVNIAGHPCTVPLSPVMNSISGHSTEWVNKHKGYADENNYYGGSEVKMWDRLNQQGNEKWVFIDDAFEVSRCDLRDIDDEIYTKYKNAHAIGPVSERFKGSFEEYLKK